MHQNGFGRVVHLGSGGGGSRRSVFVSAFGAAFSSTGRGLTCSVVQRIVPTPIQNGLKVEVWADDSAIEWHLATVWSFDLRHAILDVTVGLYPDRAITLRQDCRVVGKRGKPI